MMAQKYLHELLEEDQEPFILHKYISDRRSKIKTQIYPRKTHKPLHQNSNFPTNLCKNVCLFSFPETTTQELRKSPLFDFQSPKAKSKSPIKFQIPSRTANLLLEAALKIQKHSSSKTKSSGFSLFGSLFKRLTQRSHKRKEIEGSDLNLCVKDILKWESRKLSNGCMKEQEKLDFCNGRSSSAVWSESNEDKSLDMETWSSSSSRHCDDDCEIKEIEFVTNHHHKDNSECACCHDINGFCDSPFCFVLQKSPSFDRYTSELPSSTLSPNHHNTQDKESNGGEEEKEDKEHCSPVCVLDPPFKDDEESHGNDEEDSSNLRCSYAIIERAKQQLLYKLSRFEKLAELDPLELEKRMLEDEDENDYETLMENDDFEVEGSETSCKENEFMQLVFEAVCHSSVHEIGQIPKDLKKLVFDLIMEEDREHDKEIMIKRVCKRLELWKEVESNTIDMMIEEDFTRENERWKKNMMEIRDMASEIEVAIFSLLVEEFSKELVC